MKKFILKHYQWLGIVAILGVYSLINQVITTRATGQDTLDSWGAWITIVIILVSLEYFIEGTVEKARKKLQDQIDELRENRS